MSRCSCEQLYFWLHANGATTPNIVGSCCNNSQQVWDLQCIVGRIQPIGLCNPCVMSVRGPYNVGTTVQTDPTLVRYASAITEQKKCWELLAEKFDRFQTLRNNTQQHPTTCNKVCKRTQHVTSNNAGNCWPTMLRPFARGFTLEVNPVIFASCVYVKTFFFRSILSLIRFLFQTFDRI